MKFRASHWGHDTLSSWLSLKGLSASQPKHQSPVSPFKCQRPVVGEAVSALTQLGGLVAWPPIP